jgi:hypothetical protein
MRVSRGQVANDGDVLEQCTIDPPTMPGTQTGVDRIDTGCGAVSVPRAKSLILLSMYAMALFLL